MIGLASKIFVVLMLNLVVHGFEATEGRGDPTRNFALQPLDAVSIAKKHCAIQKVKWWEDPSTLSYNCSAYSNEDINLLAAVGSPFPIDVRAVTGPFGRYGRPAVEFTPKSYVGRYAKDLLPVPFFRDFGIKVSLFLQTAYGGVIFSVLEYNHAKSVLSLNVLQVDRRRHAIEFIYRNARGAEDTRDLVATFVVPRIDRRWTVFSITVQGQTVTLYFSGCDKVMTKVFKRRRYELAIRENSPFFIGNAGWYIQKHALYGAIYDLTIYKRFQDAIPKCHASRGPDFARNEKIEGTEGQGNNVIGGPTIIDGGREGNTRRVTRIITEPAPTTVTTSTTMTPTTTTTTPKTTTTTPTTTTTIPTTTPTTTTTTTTPTTTTTTPKTTTTMTTPTTTITTPKTTSTTTTTTLTTTTTKPTTTTNPTTTTTSTPMTTSTFPSTIKKEPLTTTTSSTEEEVRFTTTLTPTTTITDSSTSDVYSTALPEYESRKTTSIPNTETELRTVSIPAETSTHLPEFETESVTFAPQTETHFPTIEPETEGSTKTPNVNFFTEGISVHEYHTREMLEKEKRRNMSDPTPTPYPVDHSFSTVLDLYSTKSTVTDAPRRPTGIDQLKEEVKQELNRIKQSLKELTGYEVPKQEAEPTSPPKIPTSMTDNEALEATRKELRNEIKRLNIYLDNLAESKKQEMMMKEAERLDKLNPKKKSGKKDQQTFGSICDEEKVRNIVMQMLDHRLRDLRAIANGPVGFPGERGEQGKQGEKGDKGEMGDQGHKGKDGTNGINGSKGNKGEPGHQGEKGNEGLSGEKGEKGDMGEEGDQGLQGQAGRVGERGRKGEPGEQGTQGKQGRSGKDGTKGERGEKGDRGDQGKIGRDGEKGSRGQSGERGEDGEKGERGERGRKGDKGLDGAKGSTGVRGSMGPQGGLGKDGRKGEKGATGRTGFGTKGEKGNPGDFMEIKGRQGQKGDRGKKGSDGARGPTGARGLKGIKGSIGEIGIRGPKGEKGATQAASPARANVILNVNDLVLMKDMFNIGAIAFVTSTNSLYVKSLHGWLQVQTVEHTKTPLEISPLGSKKEVVDPSNQVVAGPTLTTPKPTTVKPIKVQPNLLIPPVGINAKHPYLILAALNQPHTGRMGGIPAIDSMCTEEATKSGYYSIKFQAFISDDYNEIRSMIFYKYRDLPVANTRGEQLFPSVRSIYNKKKYGVFNPDIPIYSFNQRDVRRDNTWPVKMVWHGSHADGRSHAKDKHCQNWRADVPAFRASASSIMEHLPALNEVEMRCDRKLIVLCLQIR